MPRKPTRRKVERAINRVEERRTEEILNQDQEHKVYAGFDLGNLPGTEAAQERAEDAPTVHLTEDREAAEAVLSGARVIGWDHDRDRDQGEAGDGDTEDRET